MIAIHETEPRNASAKEKARVEAWVRKYQRDFFLNVIQIKLIWHVFPEEGPDEPDNGERTDARMDLEMVHRYHIAKLNIFPCFFEDHLEAQRFKIAHEMAHIVTNPLARLIAHQHDGGLVTPDEAADADEAVTDRFARIIVYGYEGQKQAKPIRVKKKAKAKK